LFPWKPRAVAAPPHDGQSRPAAAERNPLAFEIAADRRAAEPCPAMVANVVFQRVPGGRRIQACSSALTGAPVNEIRKLLKTLVL
jgi:hypothetical protein